MNETIKKAFLEIFPGAREVDGEMVANATVIDGGEILSLSDIASAPGMDLNIHRSGTGLRISLFIKQEN